MKIDVLLAFALLASSSVTTAHEGTAHKAGPVAREQKPWGIAGDAGHARRTLAVSMSDDMRFTPDRIEVRQGETVVAGHYQAGMVGRIKGRPAAKSP